MKKIIITVISLCLLLLCFGTLISCDEVETLAPANLRIDYDTLTLKWSKVPKARAYEIQISGDEKIKTSLVSNYVLENLKPGDYTVSIRAININPELNPSEWVSIDFTREQESGLRYKLINNKTAYELTGVGTASGDIVIESTYRNKPVISIASRAFYNNKTITSVVVGENVTSIGDMAFQKCEKLSSVTFLGDVSDIGSYAFQSCKALTTVTLPEALTAIRPYTFSWCDALTSVTMGSKVQLIDEYAFSNCAALTSVQFSDGLQSISQYAFSDCVALKSVKFTNIKDIGYVAFSGCVELETVDLGASIEKIGQAAFLNCAKVAKIVIPDSLTAIEPQAFALCAGLSEVVMGSSVRSIGEDAFYGTALYNQATDILYIGDWAIVARNRNNVSISPAQGTGLKEGTIGIANGAFATNENLQLVQLEGVKYIGKSAFSECAKLTSMWCDDALIEIGQAAFYGCTSLFDVEVGESLVRIGDNAFQKCELLLNIDLPDTVTEIGSYAFRNTNAYKLAKDVVYIDKWAVDYVEKTYFDHIFIKKDTVGIANYCFYEISQMGGGFKMYDSLKYIGRGAFYGCDYASPIDITEATSIEVIGDYAFYNCMSAWFGNLGVTKLPSTVQYIGRSAFYGCSKMVGVTIPGSVKTIGDYAFYGCA